MRIDFHCHLFYKQMTPEFLKTQFKAFEGYSFFNSDGNPIPAMMKLAEDFNTVQVALAKPTTPLVVTTNDVDVIRKQFVNTSTTYAQVTFPLPKTWDGGSKELKKGLYR